jgi:hypothetical protein
MAQKAEVLIARLHVGGGVYYHWQTVPSVLDQTGVAKLLGYMSYSARATDLGLAG